MNLLCTNFTYLPHNIKNILNWESNLGRTLVAFYHATTLPLLEPCFRTYFVTICAAKPLRFTDMLKHDQLKK
jgi:hypothetical protein